MYVHIDLQINIFSCQLTHHHLPQISSFQASTACTTIGSAVSSSVTAGRSDTGQPEISSSMAEQPSTQLAWAFHGPKAEWLKICFSYSRFSLQPILAFTEPQLDWLRDFDGVTHSPCQFYQCHFAVPPPGPN